MWLCRRGLQPCRRTLQFRYVKNTPPPHKKTIKKKHNSPHTPRELKVLKIAMQCDAMITAECNNIVIVSQALISSAPPNVNGQTFKCMDYI